MADQILGWVWEHPFLPKFFSKKVSKVITFRKVKSQAKNKRAKGRQYLVV
jgi:hypothetical protein